MTKILQFPTNFYWGASTSSHQIEGNCLNDWSEWEKSESRIKNLELKMKKEGKEFNKEDFISGKGCNSYELFERDLECLKQLNCNAYRFSLEWSRIEPKMGSFDYDVVNHYKKHISLLKQNNIEPFVTIWHWPIPLWLRDRGGWLNKETIKYFCRFTEAVVSQLRDVKYWITINEPHIYSLDSYLRGLWPPQNKNPFKYQKVLANLIEAHTKAYQTIKKINQNLQVGLSHNMTHFEAGDDKIVNNVFKRTLDGHWNFSMLDKIKNELDFFGLNFYFHNRIDYGLNKNKNEKISDLGWELYPESIYHLLKDLQKYNKPIYVTENGLADEHDIHREWYIKEILKYVNEAILEGVDVRGYFHWSLLDNYEWAHGWQPKFGLYSVDRQTFVRTPRSSASVYSDICKNNRVVIS